MTIPDDIRRQVKNLLQDQANKVGWLRLPATRKAKIYEQWSKDPSIGGVLARYMDARRVRVYIKDTLLKDYIRSALADDVVPFRALDIAAGTDVAETYIKPHGRRLGDGRVVCWGRADDWKAVLIAAFERSYAGAGRSAFGAVLVGAVGRYGHANIREMVEDAAARLGVERVVWMDT